MTRKEILEMVYRQPDRTFNRFHVRKVGYRWVLGVYLDDPGKDVRIALDDFYEMTY
ncbi:MAG: hypothetical protein UV26_C0030G0011 [candidate division WWE3 bacterium GW2011_GWF2_42_42]|uniref:Uncharacterized protein n=1 Tax=candidate division WWE3 bacterium GW2011_GWF2_42_42 TaxID=1619142 RepID=A0A0G1ADR8_UNCKA|nr:MAG: hypothetical protein UV26_C0030G0011 [candidate division WWE3 bacterium GW2011_GWF2_42_42]